MADRLTSISVDVFHSMTLKEQRGGKGRGPSKSGKSVHHRLPSRLRYPHLGNKDNPGALIPGAPPEISLEKEGSR